MGRSVKLFSRNGREFLNFQSVKEALESALVGYSKPIVLDGEIISEDFQSVQRNAFADTRKTEIGTLSFHIFGAIDYDEFISGEFKQTAEIRLEQLRKVYLGLFMFFSKRSNGRSKICRPDNRN